MTLKRLSGISVTLSLNWKITLLGLLILPILLRLGFWQLERAEEKKQLLQSIDQIQSQPMVSLITLDSNAAVNQYRQVSAEGEFIKGRYWLVDNSVHLGKVGYEVVSPFVLTNKQIILVNRGWVAAPLLRSELPVIQDIWGQIQLQGRLTTPSDNRLARELEADKNWPKRIQKLQIDKAMLQLGAVLMPWVMQLSPESEYALAMEWKNVNVSPAKHQAYAVQWFAMSVALGIALIVVNIRIDKNIDQ